MLKIYNTLTKKQEEFKPLAEGQIKFYHCGPTVYWVQHIGNMRGMTMADLIRRSLIYFGNDVQFVRNYTDVGHLTSDEDEGEDKFEKARRNTLFFKCKYCSKDIPSMIQVDKKVFNPENFESNKYVCPNCGKTNTVRGSDYFYPEEKKRMSPDEIADKYIALFDRDLELLNHLPLLSENKPRATIYVPQMIKMVQILLDKGFAYSTPKAIYYDVSKKEDYTKLSGQKLDENKQGAGAGDVTDSDKKNPQDFALWFFKTGAHKNALQTWPSPFESPEVENGEGFPGWHIECSAMSQDLLGDTMDIHMGGIEHIPVHHTNEIAQSEAATGETFVNYWLHNEHLTVDGGKMSKSEGTSFVLQDIVDKGYDTLVLRYFFLNSHYRSKQNFTWEAIEASKIAYEKMRKRVGELLVQINSEQLDNLSDQIEEEYKNEFIRALEDDFNIPEALAITWNLLKSDLSDQSKLATVLDFDKVLGLGLENIETNPAEDKITPEIQAILDERAEARENKDWIRSDNLRDKLKAEFGIEVEDTDDGQKVR